MGLIASRPPKIDKLTRKGNVDGLIRALSYEDPITDSEGRVVDLGLNVRIAAAEALAGMESHAAFEGLLRALDDPEDAVRIAAVRGLRKRGDPLAAEHLTSAVTNWTQPEHAGAREEALEALAFLRDPTAPRRVAAGLLTRSTELDDKTDPAVLRRLTQAGGHDALRGTVEDLVARLREAGAPPRVRSLLMWLAPDSVEPLIAALDNPNAKREAIMALGPTHDSRAVEPLCAILLGDDDPPVRIAAAWALGEIRDPGAVQPLLVATTDRDFGVRSEASQSFDKLGNAAIALAMGGLVREALENGSRSHDAIEASEDEPSEPEQDDSPTVDAAETPAADAAAQTQVRERPVQRPGTSQALSVVRRLLDRLDRPPAGS